jgi:hypothetical protein
LRTQFPRLARPTVSLKRPDLLGVRVGVLLFRAEPGKARALARRLAREPLVSRVDQWRGEITVCAEVIAIDVQDLEDVIERYEPAHVYELIARHERTRIPLRNLGRGMP